MGTPIVMPAGDQIKGRMLNVIGQPIDGMNPLDMTGAYPIHREAPTFEELSTKKEILSTGISLHFQTGETDAENIQSSGSYGTWRKPY